jgi:threonine/homoserine efflux transporter RhtA
MGLVLLVSPWLFGFSRSGLETWIPVILALGAILMSLMTNYEYSIAKLIPMSAHLTVDFISGLLLAVSPWLFGFSHYVFVPHLILGIMEIGASLSTETKSSTSRETVSI